MKNLHRLSQIWCCTVTLTRRAMVTRQRHVAQYGHRYLAGACPRWAKSAVFAAADGTCDLPHKQTFQYPSACLNVPKDDICQAQMGPMCYYWVAT
jgi:hypothetical protein